KTAEVWDFETGKQLFEFTNAHREAAITCLTFDSSGRSYISFYIGYISVGIIASACSKEHCDSTDELHHAQKPQLWQDDIVRIHLESVFEIRYLMRAVSYGIVTFGQAEPWEVSTCASWKQPWVPYKILIDPQSLRSLVLEGASSVLQVLNSDQQPKARGKAVPEVCAQAAAFPCATGKVSSACTLPPPVKQAMETRWCT
ncbi:LOW QUALITY PROTEIN: uncharacterized protein WM294_001000, partial [Sarcoramphus papa]